MPSGRVFLGGLTKEEFLSRYWQKEPLLVRGACPGYQSPISPEELAGLALESEVESRLIEERDGTWHLTTGPFDEARFLALPASHWTLLVQDLDQHVPAAEELFRHLDFLPSFRFDDVMASYAPVGGSVGPHFDQYDVFLLQGSGQRRWQLARHFDRHAVRQDTDLCILETFQPEEEYLLEAGDLLYLPPQVAHFGVAMSPCITFSLGCRAPSVAELVSALARRAIEPLDEHQRYTDPDLEVPAEPGAIDRATLRRVSKLLTEHLRFDEQRLARTWGALMTEPKALFAREFIEPLDEQEVTATLAETPPLERRKGSRWLSYIESNETILFVDGEEFPCALEARDLVRELTRHRSFDKACVESWLQQPASAELLRKLVALELLVP